MSNEIYKYKEADFPFHPKGSQIIVIPEEESETTAGGKIIIPEACRMRLNQGRVFRTGPYVTDKIKVGEMVLWSMHMEQRIQFDRRWFYFLLEEEIMAGYNPDEWDPNQEKLALENKS